jgi:hypothetical protein
MSDFRFAPTETPPELREEFNLANPHISVLPDAMDSGDNGVARPDEGSVNAVQVSGIWRNKPNPAVGGKPGRTVGLGYSTGMNPSGYYTQRFTGDTMTVASPVIPTGGPVGMRDHAGQLAAGIHAQYSNPTPDQAAVAGMFAGHTFNNPLLNADGTVGG